MKKGLADPVRSPAVSACGAWICASCAWSEPGSGAGGSGGARNGLASFLTVSISARSGTAC